MKTWLEDRMTFYIFLRGNIGGKMRGRDEGKEVKRTLNRFNNGPRFRICDCGRISSFMSRLTVALIG